ncbi:MAG: hypothetical protein MTP17_01210 [Candidatus Midichloria sp.]|nr:MAG: hypothetical protein MTP17_01210 [Candidatus Midichloria sp.]
MSCPILLQVKAVTLVSGTNISRFKKRNEDGLLWLILYALEQEKILKIDIVFMDSTAIKSALSWNWSVRKIGKQSIGKKT